MRGRAPFASFVYNLFCCSRARGDGYEAAHRVSDLSREETEEEDDGEGYQGEEGE